MSITEIIDTLVERRIQVSLKDDQDLRVAFPQGEAVDPEMVQLLKANKQELINYLKQVAYGQQGITPAPEQDHYPVSNAQKRLWVLQQLEPSLAAYNIPVVRRFVGAVDTAALKAAYEKLVARHESLRTRFVAVDGEPRQAVQADMPVQFEVVDLQGEADAQAAANQAVEASFHQPFNLEEGPLHRMSLWQTGAQEYTFLLTIHHIIADGWSIETLNHDLMHLYRQQLDASTPELAPMAVQYKDYAVWLEQELSGESLGRHKAYWLEHMAGEIPVLNLPLDRPRPARQTFTGARIKHTLAPELKQQLAAVAKAEGASVFMGLMAALKALFFRYTGQTDMILGTPTAGRNRPELEDQIGFFINTLALRTQFESNAGFRQLLQGVKSALVGAQDHQIYPFDQLVEDLKLKRDLSRSPLFDVLVSYHEANMRQDAAQEVEGLQVLGHAMEMNIAQFDLLFDFNDWTEGLEISLMYNTDLYNEDRMRLMLAHYEALLSQLVQKPEAALANMDYLTASEKEQLLSGLNPAVTPVPELNTLVSQVEAQAAQRPEAIALQFGGGQMTYAELNQQANQLAAGLRENFGIVPGDVVGVMLDRSEHLIVSMLGIVKAGAAWLPIEPNYPEARKATVLEDSQAKALITHSAYMFDLSFYSGQLFIVDIQWEELPQDATNPEGLVTPELPAYVIYTSGSTGTPKGVLVSHQTLAHYTQHFADHYAVTEQDATALFTSYAFDLGYTSIWGALANGAKLVLVKPMESLDRQVWMNTLRDQQVSLLKLSPAHLNLMVNDPGFAEEAASLSLRALILGGEALKPADVSKFLEQKPAAIVVDEYGPTEATIGCVAKTITQENWEAYAATPSIGTPFAGHRAVILDAQKQLVPVGIPGELCIYGDGLALGYLNRPELTAEKFTQHPYLPDTRMYRTGDLVMLNAKGEIQFLGRMDHQVKVRGYRIEIGEIEHALRQHPAITETLVMVAGEGENARLVGYYQASEALNQTALRQHLGATLPEYMIPELWVHLDKFPLTANGKIDRKALPTVDALADAYEAPATQTEQTLANLWQEVLEVEQVGRTDNFFALGGHSLRGIQLVSRILREFGVKIELRELFNHPTIAELAPLVDAATQVDEEQLHHIEDEADYPVSNAQERIWIAEQLTPGTALYNMPMAIEFNGKLNEPALAKALRTLIDRHESLRTRFFDQEGSPRQQVVDPEAVSFSLEVADLTGADEAAIMTKVNELQWKPFDLTSNCLMRAEVVRAGEERSIIVLVMHHIISDGWSLDILTQELVLLYDAYIRAMDNPLEALPLQYRDYAVWQRRFLSGPQAEVQKKYWMQRFAGDIPQLNLPTDHERTAAVTNRASMEQVNLPAASLQALKALGQSQQASVYMLIQALWKVTLYQLTGDTDVVVGSPMAGRGQEKMESLVGCFLNTLAMRSTFTGEQSFRELLAQVKEETLDAFANQDYPFDRLVSDLKLDRVPGRSPLFDVGFTLQNTVGNAQGDTDAVKPEYTVASYGTGIDIVKADWWLFAWEDEEGGLSGALAYKTDLYDSATAEKLVDTLARLAELIVELPDEPLDTLIRKVSKLRKSEAKQERKKKKKKNLELFLKS